MLDFIVFPEDLTNQIKKDEERFRKFTKMLSDNEDKELNIKVFNIITQTIRTSPVIPNKKWGGKGLLGNNELE
jgi:hypothetical protein